MLSLAGEGGAGPASAAMTPIASKQTIRRAAFAAAAAAFLVGARLGRPGMGRPRLPAAAASAFPVSTEVVDRDGELLRAFATPDGRWRLAADLDAGRPAIRAACWSPMRTSASGTTSGVDLLALLRAAGQFAGNGRIVSGGSTLSMQLARLIEPRESRSLGAKLRQLLRAVQIERRSPSARSSSAISRSRPMAAISKACAPLRSPISARSRSA